jgi:divalent metal cation (Fe/Co/Zn/Cd) transporter
LFEEQGTPEEVLGLFLYQVTGMVIFDSLASALVGLLLGGLALLLGYESRSLLLGEAASPETRQKIGMVRSSASATTSGTRLTASTIWVRMTYW